MIGPLVIVAGVVCLVASALAWTGRWRAWSRRVLTGPLLYPITIVPGAGVAMIGLGLVEAGAIASDSPLVAVSVVAMLAGMVLYFWAPDWLGPRWLKAERADGIQPDVSDPLTAMTLAATGPAPGRASSATLAQRHADGREPLDRFRATWIQHEHGGPKPHGLGRAGAIDGLVEVHDDRLIFRPTELEDRLREEAAVAVIEAGDVLGARSVPRGAGPDGARRKVRGARSMFARLVVDTAEGPYLFEVHGAAHKARQVNEAFGA